MLLLLLKMLYIYKNELKKKSSKRSILQLLNDIDDDIIADTIKILKNKEFNNIEKAINNLSTNGYSAHQIIIKLGNYILHSELSELDKANFSIFLSNVEYKLVKGEMNICNCLPLVWNYKIF